MQRRSCTRQLSSRGAICAGCGLETACANARGRRRQPGEAIPGLRSRHVARAFAVRGRQRLGRGRLDGRARPNAERPVQGLPTSQRLFEQFRLFHRKDKADDLMAATRYGVMMRRYAQTVRARRNFYRRLDLPKRPSHDVDSVKDFTSAEPLVCYGVNCSLAL